MEDFSHQGPNSKLLIRIQYHTLKVFHLKKKISIFHVYAHVQHGLKVCLHLWICETQFLLELSIVLFFIQKTVTPLLHHPVYIHLFTY